MLQLRKDQWASGAFLHERSFASAIAEARAIGNCEMAQVILDLEFEEIGEKEDGKY